jgi:hypothetical protein
MTKTSDQWKSLPKTPAGWVGFLGLVAGAFALVVWLCWSAMRQVSADTARAWALIATVLVPVVGYVAWRLGQTEARSRLAGIDQAVNKVMDVARRTADVRVRTVSQMRQAATKPAPPPVPEPQLPALPQPTVIHRGPDQGDRRVIDL